MNREPARVEIVTAISAAAQAWTSYICQVDYDNKDHVDYATQLNPYLAVDIVYMDAQQMDLGTNPIVQAYGNIMLAVSVKEGKGTSQANLLMAHFTSALQFKLWPLVETYVARPQPNAYRKGWCSLLALIPFHHQEQI